MRKIFYVEALREALREEMERDPNVFLLGEDIGPFGGVFKVTEGLYKKFDSERVRQTPISEAAIIGIGLGAAIVGMRPICELMFIDFLPLAGDQIFNQVAKIRYMTGGQAKVPLVIRTNIGAGRSAAAQHSQSIHAWACHIPGIKVVLPSNPYDAKGLLKTAIRDDNPVLFLEHKFLYKIKGEVPEEEYTIPLGKASIKTEGKDVTVVAISSLVSKAINVSKKLSVEGISVEVIDPRTLIPYDRDTITNSVKKTGHLVVADEGHINCGICSEIAMKVIEDAFYYLETPIRRVAAPNVPIPFCPSLEKLCIPAEENIEKAIRSSLK
ncbi:MAG: alpha-ketoacid dehydrogenase subunit beta [Atribacterota bacterium]